MVFERTEHYFREATSHTDLRNIPIASVISKSIHDVDVLAAYNAMQSDSELVNVQRCSSQYHAFIYKSTLLFVCEGHHTETQDQIKTAEIESLIGM